MGQIHYATKVRLISAFCYNDKKLMQQAVQKFCDSVGDIDSTSQVFEFDHTPYYQKEMGKDLNKVYMSFKNLINPEEIIEIKHLSNSIEDQLSSNGQRNVNIDPGYIEIPKLVLATTKNYGHRIYLGKGIYGDVQLFWRDGAFQTNPWTYPDYKEIKSIDFFTDIRKKLLERGEK